MAPVLGAAGAGEASRTLLPVAVVLVRAQFGGLDARTVRVPAVLGELIVGMLLGQAGRAGLLGFPDLAGDRTP